jgi:hypothetical protein
MPINSHVTVARQGADTKCFSLQNVYRIRDGSPLISTAPQDWRPGQTLPRKDRRDNYRDITINTATVVSEEQQFVRDVMHTACKECLAI